MRVRHENRNRSELERVQHVHVATMIPPLGLQGGLDEAARASWCSRCNRLWRVLEPTCAREATTAGGTAHVYRTSQHHVHNTHTHETHDTASTVDTSILTYHNKKRTVVRSDAILDKRAHAWVNLLLHHRANRHRCVAVPPTYPHPTNVQALTRTAGVYCAESLMRFCVGPRRLPGGMVGIPSGDLSTGVSHWLVCDVAFLLVCTPLQTQQPAHQARRQG